MNKFRGSFWNMNKLYLLLVFVFPLFFCQLTAAGLSDLVRSYPPKSVAENQPGHNMLFSFYDKYVSPVDGERCRMSPSCSVYSRYAIQKKGYMAGLLMSFDRLMRCGNDLNEYPRIYEGNLELYWDPVSTVKSEAQ